MLKLFLHLHSYRIQLALARSFECFKVIENKLRMKDINLLKTDADLRTIDLIIMNCMDGRMRMQSKGFISK